MHELTQAILVDYTENGINWKNIDWIITQYLESVRCVLENESLAKEASISRLLGLEEKK